MDAAWTERKGGRWKIDENGGRSSNNGGSNELFTVHGACIVAGTQIFSRGLGIPRYKNILCRRADP